MDLKTSIDEGIRTPSTCSEADDVEWHEFRYMTPEAILPPMWAYPVLGTAHMSFGGSLGSALTIEEQSWHSTCQMGHYAQVPYYPAEYMLVDDGMLSPDSSCHSDHSDDIFDQAGGLPQYVPGHVVELATANEAGSRLIQRALTSCPYRITSELVKEMRGHVIELVDSPWGNFALTQAIHSLPRKDTLFIVEEVMQDSRWLTTHQFGIRLFQRLAETHGATASGLLGRVAEDTADLATDPFGNFAIKAILEHGTERHREQVATILFKQGVVKLSVDPFGTNVIQQALTRCSETHRSMLVGELVNAKELLQNSQCGRHVLEALQEAYPTLVVQADGDQCIPWANPHDFCQKASLEDLREYARPLLEVAKINRFWSKALQDAIGKQAKTRPRECAQILKGMLCGGQLKKVVTSRHGNFVVSEFLTLKNLKSTKLADFCIHELRGSVAEVSMNQFGYRTVVNLIKYSHNLPRALATEIIAAACELAVHPYGNFVLKMFIQKIDRDRLKILMASLKYDKMTQDKYGQYVLQALLKKMPNDDHLLRASEFSKKATKRSSALERI
jgi:hypothetical protein